MSFAMVKGVIVAISPKRVIGLGGRIPWHYPADLRRFKRLTMGGTIVMGRRTWESLPKRPLPGRRNIVITSTKIEGVESFPSLSAALETVEGDVWFIGGAQLYDEALEVADLVDITYVPDEIDDRDAIGFPELDPALWVAGPRVAHEEDARLERQVFTRRPINSMADCVRREDAGKDA